MIVDYNKFTQCLLQKLSEQYKTNYFTVNDVANVINEIKEPLSKQIEITDETKNTIKNMTTKELLKEINNKIELSEHGKGICFSIHR